MVLIRIRVILILIIINLFVVLKNYKYQRSERENDVISTRRLCRTHGRNNMAAVNNVSLSKLQSLNGIFAIYKTVGPTSAEVLNSLKQKLLHGQ